MYIITDIIFYICMRYGTGAAEGIETWCGKWKNRIHPKPNILTRSVFQITHKIAGNRTHVELAQYRRCVRRSVHLCGKCRRLVGWQPHPSAEVSRADCS